MGSDPIRLQLESGINALLSWLELGKEENSKVDGGKKKQFELKRFFVSEADALGLHASKLASLSACHFVIFFFVSFFIVYILFNA